MADGSGRRAAAASAGAPLLVRGGRVVAPEPGWAPVARTADGQRFSGGDRPNGSPSVTRVAGESWDSPSGARTGTIKVNDNP